MSNKRRNFIKGLGFGTIVFGAIGYGVTTSDKKTEKKKPHFGMIFDQNKCVGCGDCEIGCGKANNIPTGQFRLFMEDQTNPDNKVNKKFMRVSCQQCEDSPCTSVCPSKACHKDSITNIVTMNVDDCIGCKYCIVACPYDVRFMNNDTRAAENCNFCNETNLAEGKEPACVESCKYDAIVFGDFNKEDDYMNKILAVKDSIRLRPGYGTRPSLRYIPKIKRGVYDE